MRRWVRGLGKLVGWIVLAWLVTLGMAFVPVLAVMVGCFSIFPGIVLVVGSAIQARSAKVLGQNLLAAYVYLPLMLAGLGAPLLALGLLGETYIPGCTGLMTGKWEGSFEPPVIDRILLYLAAAAILGLVLILVRELIWLTRQLRMVENLATSRIGSAALGLVELVGAYRPEAGQGAQPVNFWAGGLRQPFYLEDASGKVRVDPRTPALTRSLLTALFRLELCDTEITRAELKAGDPVYVLGSLELDETRQNATGLEALVVRRRSRAGAPLGERMTELRNSFLGGGDKTRSDQDLFFLADGDETAVRRRLRQRRWSIALRGGALVALCLWLLFTRLWQLFPLDLAVRNPAFQAVNLSIEQKRLIQYCYHSNPKYREYGVKTAASSNLPHGVKMILFLDQIGLDDAWIRAKAAEVLTQELKPADSAFAPQLVALTTAPDATRRQAGIEGLVAVRAPWSMAGPVMLRALADADPAVRIATARALENWAPAAVEAIEPLSRCLGDDTSRLDYFAESTLMKFGALARPRLEQTLAGDNELAAVHALVLLARAGPAEADLAALQTGMRDPRPAVRQTALWTIEYRDPETNRPLEADLRAALHQADPSGAEAIVPVAAKQPWFGWQEADLAILLQAVRSPKMHVRQSARKVAARFPALGERLLPVFLECVTDADDGVAADAMIALQAYGLRALPALPALTAALADRNRQVNAAGAIGAIGPAAHNPDTVRALRSLLDPDGWSQGAYVTALLRMRDLPFLRECLTPAFNYLTWTALSYLQEAGPDAAWAVPVLLDRFKLNSQDEAAHRIVAIFQAIGRPAREALPAIEAALNVPPDRDAPLEYRRAQLELLAPEPPADLAARQVGAPLLQWPLLESALDSTGAHPPLEKIQENRYQMAAGRKGLNLSAGATLTYCFDPPLDLSAGYSVEWWQIRAYDVYWVGSDMVTSNLWALNGTAHTLDWTRQWVEDGAERMRHEAKLADTWVHLAVSYDPYRRRCALFVQGRLVMEADDFRVGYTIRDGRRFWNESHPVNHLSQLQFGNPSEHLNSCWQGSIVDLRIYNVPRTAAQIAVAAQAGIASGVSKDAP